MPNYKNSVIYKIYCKDPNIKNMYIGSTTNFNRRKYDHKNCYNNIKSKEYNKFLYKFIRDHKGWENWDMIIIKNISCNCKKELLKIEDKYIKECKNSLNSKSAYYFNRKEYKKKYRKNNKEKIRQYNKEYYYKNKEKIKERLKQKKYCQYCNCHVNLDNFPRHCRSIKHNKNLNKSIQL